MSSEKSICNIERFIDDVKNKELRKKIEKYIVNNMFPSVFHKASNALTKAIEENRFEIYIGFRIKNRSKPCGD